MAGGLLAAAGCSDADGDGEDPASNAQFMGAWRYISGMSSTDCVGDSEPLAGTVTISRGPAASLMSMEASCTLALEVQGNTASARAGQSCMQTDQGRTFTVAITAYTFTVDGTEAEKRGSGTARLNGPGGPVDCTLTSMGRLQRVP
jgi:hypothetical protein